MQELIVTTLPQLQEAIKQAIAEELNSFFPKESKPFADFPDFVTIGEAAVMCNVSKGTINNWIGDGRIKPTKNGRVVRFAKSDIIQLLGQKPKYKRY